MKPGDEIIVVDGSGATYVAIIRNIDIKAVDVAILRPYHSTAESPLRVTIAQAMLKGPKMDVSIQHLTELGIMRWIPYFAKRSVPVPDPKRMVKRLERWKKIAQESVKQCQRSKIPDIVSPCSFESMLDLAQECKLKIAFWENAAHNGSLRSDIAGEKPFSEVFVVLGPEGGFDPHEIDSMRKSGFITATLGPRILRAETATLSACTIIQFLLGDMG